MIMKTKFMTTMNEWMDTVNELTNEKAMNE